MHDSSFRQFQYFLRSTWQRSSSRFFAWKLKSQFSAPLRHFLTRWRHFHYLQPTSIRIIPTASTNQPPLLSCATPTYPPLSVAISLRCSCWKDIRHSVSFCFSPSYDNITFLYPAVLLTLNVVLTCAPKSPEDHVIVEMTWQLVRWWKRYSGLFSEIKGLRQVRQQKCSNTN